MASEVVEVVFENHKIRIERIRSFGVASGADFWYNNDCDEWVSLTKGSAVLELEDKMVELKAEDSLYIKANVRHRVEFTSMDCEWLCVYVKNWEGRYVS